MGNLFVCGLHRSGTSMIARAIADHPDVASFRNSGVVEDEGQYLQNILPHDLSTGGPGRFAFDPASHLTESSPYATRSNAAALLAQWAPAHEPGRRWLVEKTPSNLLRTRLLQALFPQARFVVVTRHPIAVALATQKWTHTSPFALIAHWLRAHDLFAADRPYLRHVLMISYEAFVADPAAQLARVWRFLELPPCAVEIPAMDANRAYFERWQTDLARATPPTLPRPRSLWQSLRKRLKFSLMGCPTLRRQEFGRCSDTLDATKGFDAPLRAHGYSMSDLALFPCYSDAAAQPLSADEASANLAAQ